MDHLDHTPHRLHPLIATAAISVIIASCVVIAAMTGLLPTSHGNVTPIRKAIPTVKTVVIPESVSAQPASSAARDPLATGDDTIEPGQLVPPAPATSTGTRNKSR